MYCIILYRDKDGGCLWKSHIVTTSLFYDSISIFLLLAVGNLQSVIDLF